MNDIHLRSDGVATKYRIDDDAAHVQTVQNIGNMVEDFRHLSDTINTKAEGRLAARIPIVLYESWQREWKQKHSDTCTFKQYVVMQINSPDYKHLRNQVIR